MTNATGSPASKFQQFIDYLNFIMTKVVGSLSSLLMIVAGIALAMMMVQVCADVIGKYVFNKPVPLTLELVSNYYMVAVVFLPLLAVELMDGNIKVDLLYSHFPRGFKRSLDLLSLLFGIFLFWFLTTSTWVVAVKKYNVGEFIMGSYSVSIWQSRFLVPIGTSLVCLLLILKFFRTLIWLIRPDLDMAENASTMTQDDPIAGTAI